MTQTVSVDEAQDKLPDLLAQAVAGNGVIIRARHASGALSSGCGALKEEACSRSQPRHNLDEQRF
jgi:hypothetical protein